MTEYNINDSKIKMSDLISANDSVASEESPKKKSSITNQNIDSSQLESKIKEIEMRNAKALLKNKKRNINKSKIPKINKIKVSKDDNIISDDYDSNERAKLLLIIQRYQAHEKYGPLCKKIGIKYTSNQLDKMDVKQLDDVLARIRNGINNTHGEMIIDFAIKNGAIIYEKLLSPYYNIDGFANNLMKSNEFNELIEIYKIESTIPYIPIEIRLLLTVALMTFTTHQMNKLSSQLFSSIPEPEMSGNNIKTEIRQDNIIN